MSSEGGLEELERQQILLGDRIENYERYFMALLLIGALVFVALVWKCLALRSEIESVAYRAARVEAAVESNFGYRGRYLRTLEGRVRLESLLIESEESRPLVRSVLKGDGSAGVEFLNPQGECALVMEVDSQGLPQMRLGSKSQPHQVLLRIGPQRNEVVVTGPEVGISLGLDLKGGVEKAASAASFLMHGPEGFNCLEIVQAKEPSILLRRQVNDELKTLKVY